jgi:hypothetical protein
MNKTIGLVLLALGIGITGATGAALSTDFRAYMALEGELKFAEALYSEAHDAYCTERVEAIGQGLSVEGALADGCEVEGHEAPEAEAEVEETEEADEEAKESQKRVMELAEAVFTTDELSPELASLRSTWIDRWSETVPPMQALEDAEVVVPGTRVSQWFSANGGLFLLGLAFVLGGSVISRRALKAELSGDEGEEEGAVDFGELLGRIVTEAQGIQAQMTSLDAPTIDDLDAIQVRLERLQKEDLARLVGAGPRLQMKLGIGPFASVFSPLAGGERRLNRVWSTLVDRHWPEAVRSIEVGVAQLELAKQAFEEASKAA